MGDGAVVDASGSLTPSSAVLRAAANHIESRCSEELIAFLKCRKEDPNPRNCIHSAEQVNRCIFGLIKHLHQSCPKELAANTACIYYNTNEPERCLKEQQALEEACPLH